MLCSPLGYTFNNAACKITTASRSSRVIFFMIYVFTKLYFSSSCPFNSVIRWLRRGLFDTGHLPLLRNNPVANLNV